MVKLRQVLKPLTVRFLPFWLLPINGKLPCDGEIDIMSNKTIIITLTVQQSTYR